ncbi:hypothetical protein HMPREF0380_01722 [Eubacterium infirmum F0142]|nr:hypothetical protein HMPREF0380_01722 [Eubacterium infirmum F0142]STO01326.1 Uncharacterised protein [[Eubacterium] infirmum]
MAREWQQTKLREYLMPNAVYYQSLWAVRDIQRMEMRINELSAEKDTVGDGQKMCETGKSYSVSKPVEKKAMEILLLQERVNAIKRALATVPKEYRRYILSNIIMQNPGTTFPNNMWRQWKQRFLFDVAKNLSLM